MEVGAVCRRLYYGRGLVHFGCRLPDRVVVLTIYGPCFVRQFYNPTISEKVRLKRTFSLFLNACRLFFIHLHQFRLIILHHSIHENQ